VWEPFLVVGGGAAWLRWRFNNVIDHLLFIGVEEKPTRGKTGLVWAFNFRKSPYRPSVGAFTLSRYRADVVYSFLLYSICMGEVSTPPRCLI
jgi:hypothetical protein